MKLGHLWRCGWTMASHREWSKSERESLILYINVYTSNLKKTVIDDLIYKAEAETQRTNVWTPSGGWGGNELGDWG